MDGNVQREDLALLPRQKQQTLFAGPADGFHLPGQFGTRLLSLCRRLKLRRLNLLILQLVRLLDFFFRFLSGNQETGDTAAGNVAQKANHFALSLARHFHAVDLQKSITGAQPAILNRGTCKRLQQHFLVKLIVIPKRTTRDSRQNKKVGKQPGKKGI